MKFRADTWDTDIYKCVAIFNEYKLPEKFEPNTIVIDIGAHIGSFSKTCINRGAETILAFEPHPENFKLCAENVPEAQVFNLAVHSDYSSISLPIEFPGVNTGGLAVSEGKPSGCYLSPTITLNEITKPFKYISIIKLDCEGSEYSILSDFKEFSKVKEFVGEYHLSGLWSLEELKNLFKANGFEFKHEEAKEDNNLGHFWAWQDTL